MRAVIIGSGGISACHLRGYRACGTEVVACCDIDEKKLRNTLNNAEFRA